MFKHPLAEVFGFPVDDFSREASRHRRLNLCPYNNKVPNCTKDKANNPLGVCSIFHESKTVITCPVRFRQDWRIAEDAASFFFPPKTKWTSLAEVRLNDADGKSAGNIDIVLVAYHKAGRVTDYGALEVQGVYISGNVRRLFENYIKSPRKQANMDWTQQTNYPRPDYLSSSRKRLVPQLLFKGGILHSWGKKIAVALHKDFYETLPELEETTSSNADIAWLNYDLKHNNALNRYSLERHSTVYTGFEASLDRISKPALGDETGFIGVLQAKLDEKLDNGNPPDAPTIDIFN